MARSNRRFKPRRRENLNPTDRINKLWDHYLKWKNTEPAMRGLWTNYRRLGKFNEDAIGNKEL